MVVRGSWWSWLVQPYLDIEHAGRGGLGEVLAVGDLVQG